jgi:5-methylcytosine-specific restriction endonuclease McrA
VNRRAELKRPVEAIRAFNDRARLSTSLKRSELARRRPKRDTELTKREAELQIAFRLAAWEQGECQSCGYKGASMEAHHAIAKSKLKRLLARKGAPCPPEVLHDPRNSLLLCAGAAPLHCHDAHTSRSRPLRRGHLRPANWEFAREHGLEFVLEAEYR